MRSICCSSLRISIHASREGGDNLPTMTATALKRFQSTPPAREATTVEDLLDRLTGISIHASREGGDRRRFCLCYG